MEGWVLVVVILLVWGRYRRISKRSDEAWDNFYRLQRQWGEWVSTHPFIPYSDRRCQWLLRRCIQALDQVVDAKDPDVSSATIQGILRHRAYLEDFLVCGTYEDNDGTPAA